MLSSIIDLLAIFPYCRNNSINNNFNLADKKLSVPLELYCSIETYDWTKTFQASKKNYNNTKGMKPFELNYRSDLAMGQISKGQTALSTLCCYMNIPEPMNKKT